MLGKKLRKIKHIKALSISNVPGFGNVELLSLAPFLNSTKSLRTLDLSGASFNGTAVDEIQRFFRRNSSLEVLNLEDNQCLGDDGVESIISSLESNTKKKNKLKVLALNNCGIGGYKGLSSLSTFITQGNGRNLAVLELSNNTVSDDGARMLSQVLKSNRSIHTLSLQNNTEITDLGASSILSSLGIYKATSINMIVGSNHVLKSLNLDGCNISSELLNQVKQLSAQSRLLSTENGVIRLKVSDYYLKNAQCGVALEEYDLELMPYILAFVGKSGSTTLFYTLQSMPILYSQYSPQVKSLTNEKTVDNLFKLPTQSRRMRKYYDIFSRQVSNRHTKMVRYQDRRMRNKHEASSASIRSNKSNKKRSLSSNTHLSFTL